MRKPDRFTSDTHLSKTTTYVTNDLFPVPHECFMTLRAAVYFTVKEWPLHGYVSTRPAWRLPSRMSLDRCYCWGMLAVERGNQ